MASATIRFGWPVLTPTSVRRPKASASVISQVWGYLRVALSERDSQTRLPGAARPIMEPVLGQVAVIDSPVSRMTSARNLLYRCKRRPGMSG